MNYKDVKLASGKTVRVHVPPLTKIYDTIRKRLPEPKAPIRTDKTATGREISMVIEDDPEYLEAHERWEEEFTEAVDEATWIWALREEWPPEDFSWDGLIEMILFVDPSFEPRTDKIGAKLDWLQWVLLENMSDQALIQNTIQEVLGVREEVVEQTEASFPGDVEGETSGGMAEEGVE